MNIIDLELPDLSGHPEPPQVTLEVYERWVFEMFAMSREASMTHEKMLAEWQRNEGSQTEEWPDFGAR